MIAAVLFLGLLAVVAALPADPVIYKLEEQRFQNVIDGDGEAHLVDLSVKASDLEKMPRYDADSENVYHLFTRSNPSRSQVLVKGNIGTVTRSNYDANKRTAVVIHGWTNNATSQVNRVILPSFLAAEDLNVIVVDWGAGARDSNYTAALFNSISSGESVARFITWLNSVTGATLSSYHIVGHSLGGHQSGIVGRNLGGEVAYITALDPALPEWVTNTNKFRDTDGIYTEVIHTGAGDWGYVDPLGDVDFYPNGGANMPGCNTIDCDHDRAFYYFGESLRSNGFTGTRCDSQQQAAKGDCSGSSLGLGGIQAKTGQTGIYYLETNAAPPFSRG